MRINRRQPVLQGNPGNLHSLRAAETIGENDHGIDVSRHRRESALDLLPECARSTGTDLYAGLSRAAACRRSTAAAGCVSLRRVGTINGEAFQFGNRELSTTRPTSALNRRRSPVIPVMLPPGRARLAAKPSLTGSAMLRNDDGYRGRRALCRMASPALLTTRSRSTFCRTMSAANPARRNPYCPPRNVLREQNSCPRHNHVRANSIHQQRAVLAGIHHRLPRSKIEKSDTPDFVLLLSEGAERHSKRTVPSAITSLRRLFIRSPRRHDHYANSREGRRTAEFIGKKHVRDEVQSPNWKRNRERPIVAGSRSRNPLQTLTSRSLFRRGDRFASSFFIDAEANRKHHATNTSSPLRSYLIVIVQGGFWAFAVDRQLSAILLRRRRAIVCVTTNSQRRTEQQKRPTREPRARIAM